MASDECRNPKEKTSILVVGDGVVATGFSRVVHSILKWLTDKYEIHHLALHYNNQDHDFGWKIYPAGADGDFLGTNRLDPLIEEIRPGLIFLINDLWVVANYMKVLKKYRDRLAIVAYSPVDGGPIEPSLIAGVEDLHALVLYTQFAHRVVEEAIGPLGNGRQDSGVAELYVIPHGVDTDVFFPYSHYPGLTAESGKRLARERLFRNSNFADAFIVLNANRNQPRKRIDITMKGFAQFARDKPDNVKLYLHMGVEDCGWNVVSLAKRYGIEDRLVLTADQPFLPAVTDEVLNAIYNACEVGINTAIGEGWGLVSFEHAAAGAAQVVPRHSACEEIWQDSAMTLEPCMSLTTERILTEGHFVPPEEVARTLNSLYEDPALLAEQSARSFATSTRPEYRWSNIARQWEHIFQKVLEVTIQT